jgi:hypothetical protein
MPDDHYQSEKLIRKSLLSYKGLIPSINFNEDEYSYYLQYASADELEKDIVSEKTYLKMVYEGNGISRFNSIDEIIDFFTEDKPE